MEELAPPFPPPPPPPMPEQGQGQGQGHSGRRTKPKPTLSCNLCRRRKLRCDRQQPCQTCSSRGLSLACSYNHNNPVGLGPHHTSRPSVQDRLVQLEQLVMKVIQKHNISDNNASTPLATNSQRTDTIIGAATTASTSLDNGCLLNGENESQYVSTAHWAAILDGIADLKENTHQPAHGSSSSHPQLLYGCMPTSREAILATLPPRPTVDRGISCYFNRLDLAPYVVHNTQFLREYEKFWLNPNAVSIIWIGLLFSMICLAVLSDEPTNTWTREERNPLIDIYRETIVQCLVIGEYTNQKPYVLETLYHYITIEYSIRKDADKNLWLLMATGVNLAMGMGYHRDASHFPKLSPFVGEMRRRTWATLIQGDILISTQMGMPRLIKDWQCDVAEPRNLNDADFDENTKVLPPSRPETEMTASLNIIARRRVFKAVGAAIDLAAMTVPYPYSEVMRVDRMIQEAKDSIPLSLRMKPLQLSVTDPPQVITHRLLISLMFHKGTIILHHKYLNTDQTDGDDAASAYSRNACVDACLSLLEMQQVFHEEVRPGGLLHVVRWRASSFILHEFLTATMVLCWILHRGVDKLWPAHAPITEDQIKNALQKAHSIWVSLSSTSRDAQRASEILTLVFNNQSNRIPHFSGSQPEPLNLTGGMDLQNANFNMMAQFEEQNFPPVTLESLEQYQMAQNPLWDMNFMGSWESAEQPAPTGLKVTK